MGKNGYSIQQLGSGGSIKIIANDAENRNKIMNCLTESGFGYSSYNNKDEKKKCFVLRGIIDAMQPDDIKNALLTTGVFGNGVVVTRLITGFQCSNPDKHHNILFKVVVDAGFDAGSLKNINIINGNIIKWEKLKSKSVLQCKNCQRFWHSAGQCFYQKRCVKCILKHTGECPRNTNQNIPLKCVNCGGTHSANNYNECTFFKKHNLPQIEKKKNGGGGAQTNEIKNQTKNQNGTGITGMNAALSGGKS